MSDFYLRTKATKSENHEVLLKFKSEKLLKSAEETGAVIEKGISIFSLKGFNEDEFAIPIEDNHNDSMNHPKQPYVESGAAYFPIEETEEMIEVYKLIKKLDFYQEEYDLRQFETLKEKIKFIYDNAFCQRIYPNNKNIPKTRKICFCLCLICGIMHTMEGKTLIYTLYYLCALLQLDFITLIQIVMASSISEEKKNFILNSLKAHGINPEIVYGDTEITFYTKFEDFEGFEKLSLK